MTAAITQPLKFPFSTDDELASKRNDMKISLEPEIGDDPCHDADNTPPNLDSQAVATPTRKQQNMRAAAFKSEPKNLSPFLADATPAASFPSLPPEVLYEVWSHPTVPPIHTHSLTPSLADIQPLRSRIPRPTNQDFYRPARHSHGKLAEYDQAVEAAVHRVHGVRAAARGG